MATDASRSLFHERIKEICQDMDIPKADAFPRWLCRNILGIINEGEIDEAVSIGGRNDFGVDIFYINDSKEDTEQYVCWIQAKFANDLDHIVTREEIETFASTLGHLRSCPDSARDVFKQKSAEFIKMEGKNPEIRKKMIFAVTGRINDQVKELINNPKWLEEKHIDNINSNVDFVILDLNEILSQMTIPYTPRIQIKFNGTVIERTDDATKKKSIIGYIAAKNLVKISKEHQETLFLENPRQTLGNSAPTYKAIINTLSDQNSRKKFWKLNNGITAICTGFEATNDSNTYYVDNFKIVNGRQTTYTLENSIGTIDDVFLLVAIHEAVDDKERNQISEATNTQNPITPVDLVTNYPEMTDLVSQCKTSFDDFYFERQTKGFDAVNQHTKGRVTWRRVLRKGDTGRTYYAYAIDPNGATVPDKVLFSVTNQYYDRIFKDRNIRDLIIPHIFMSMLYDLHKDWCNELNDNPSKELLRNKGLISKNIVRYYILKFIYESMLNIDESDREKIKTELINKFRKLKKNDKSPELFSNIAKYAYDLFMLAFDTDRSETWPPELLKKINDKKYEENDTDIPTPFEIMSMLRQNGPTIYPHLMRIRKQLITQVDDKVKSELLKLL